VLWTLAPTESARSSPEDVGAEETEVSIDTAASSHYQYDGNGNRTTGVHIERHRDSDFDAQDRLQQEACLLEKGRLWLAILVLLSLIACVLWTRRVLLVDRCLDNGGRWNTTLGRCERLSKLP
jgi:hypothetical protein